MHQPRLPAVPRRVLAQLPLGRLVAAHNAGPLGEAFLSDLKKHPPLPSRRRTPEPLGRSLRRRRRTLAPPRLPVPLLRRRPARGERRHGRRVNNRPSVYSRVLRLSAGCRRVPSGARVVPCGSRARSRGGCGPWRVVIGNQRRRGPTRAPNFLLEFVLCAWARPPPAHPARAARPLQHAEGAHGVYLRRPVLEADC